MTSSHRSHLCTALFLVGFGLLFIPKANANGGGYDKGGLISTGAFKPFGLSEVEMVSERLEIDLHIEYAEVRIEYLLSNPGSKVTIEAGFPSAVRENNWGLPSQPSLDSQMKLENVAIEADGQALEATVVPDDLKLRTAQLRPAPTGGLVITAWHVFKMEFKKGQTRRLTVRYRNPYSTTVSYVSDDWRRSGKTLSYVFSSAAAWKGPIQQGTVNIRAVSIDPSLVELSHPKRFKQQGNTWSWLFTDLEPSLEDDLTIVAVPGRNSPSTEGLAESDPRAQLHYVRWDKGHPNGGVRWEVHSQEFTAKASSTLPSEGSLHYAADNLTNHSRQTSWVEGAAGPGIGETVTLTLPKPAKVSRVGLVNGYAKDQERYDTNNRVKRLEVRVNDGKPYSVAVPDERLTTEHFYFDLPEPHNGVKTITLTIAEVYKGTKFDDTCLTEVVLVTPLSKEPKLPPVR